MPDIGDQIGASVVAAQDKVLSARQAVEQIHDGATVALVGAGGGIVEPDLLMEALGERYDQTGHPAGLTLVHTCGMGDRRGRGMAPLARAGLIKRIIAGHFGQCPPISALIESNEIEAYNVPLGTLSLVFREIAAGRPGLVTPIGLGSFVDPRVEGGRMNDITPPGVIELVELGGEEFLFYPSFDVDFALIRASYGDPAGYLSLAEETSYLDVYEVASAAKVGRGTVISQVRKVVSADSLEAKDVVVPGILVDGVVEHPSQWQTYEAADNPAYASTVRVPYSRDREPLNQRGVIARRAALEIRPDDVLNLGVGIPDGIAGVLAEEGVDDRVTFTIEHGIVGGVTAQGAIFGASVNARAVLNMSQIIDLYHAGGLDAAFLGFAQFDFQGNVNVSRFGTTVMGTGGFIDIAQNTPRLVFCGTLTAGGLQTTYEDGRFGVAREGSVHKAMQAVDQVTFSGEQAVKLGQQVLFVTERAVFELTPDGVALKEVAPGAEVERDVLGVCDFDPLVPDDPDSFPLEILTPGPVGLADRWARVDGAGAAG